jgi:hypothetical protein
MVSDVVAGAGSAACAAVGETTTNQLSQSTRPIELHSEHEFYSLSISLPKRAATERSARQWPWRVPACALSWSTSSGYSAAFLAFLRVQIENVGLPAIPGRW